MKFLPLLPLSFALALAPFAYGETDPTQIAGQELPALVTLYKDLHAHPELSSQEEKTSALLAKELKAVGCEVTEHIGKYETPGLTGYGVVGVMKNGDGPTVMIRSEMDALPVEEETGLPYASKATSKTPDSKEVHVMHACGHDIHMAVFVGAARALAKMKDQWKGTIVFVAQPAEETGSGAKAMLADGLYTRFPKPDYAIGFHDNAEMAAGKIGYRAGYACANVDSVDVTVRGVGGHGAYPHKTKDPVVLAASIVMELQTIVSRENNPLDPIVITVGSIHGGTKHNIISDEVKMQLTVRTYKPDVRQHTLDAIARVAKGMAIAAGFPEDRMPIVKVSETDFTPSMYNNPELTERLVQDWKGILGDNNVIERDPTMGGEDFSEFSLPDHSIPACNFWIGAVAPEKIAAAEKSGQSLPSLHSSKFAPVPDPTIKTGLIGVISAVLDLMKK
ncbi:MAG: amidohydrolase [Spartobacteria bacterium]